MNPDITTLCGRLVALASLGLVLLSAGCSDDGADEMGTGADETGTETGAALGLEIVGSYTDEFGDMHEITETTWTNGGGSFEIAEYKNEADWLVAQNDEANQFNPGAWSRFDWAWEGETLYYCQSVFDAATIDEAVEGSADATDLATGCGGFAWTNLTP